MRARDDQTLIKRFFFSGRVSSSNSLPPQLDHHLHVTLSPTVTLCVQAVGVSRSVTGCCSAYSHMLQETK
jgi:hypothetical protein